LEAPDRKATNVPSKEMDGSVLRPFAGTPDELTLTRLRRLRARSRTKMSVAPFRSRETRLEASLAKTTKRPSAEMAGP
jgi:hypothetical protein